MPECKYCGKSAGLFRNAHSECERKHDLAAGAVHRMIYDAILSGRPLVEVRQQAEHYACFNCLTLGEARAAIAEAWNEALDIYLADAVLSDDEMQRLLLAARQCEIDPQTLRNMGVDRKIAAVKTQMAADQKQRALDSAKRQFIDALRRGQMQHYPYVTPALPFFFDSGQSLVWLFQNAIYEQEKTRRQTVRNSSGLSYHGAYVGEARYHTTENTAMERQDVGMIALTPKHLYFAGAQKSFRVPYVKIVTLKPYKDAIELVREGVTAKRQVLHNLDGNFACDVIRALGSQAD